VRTRSNLRRWERERGQRKKNGEGSDGEAGNPMKPSKEIVSLELW
jgi:hypothetical protein